MTMGEEPYVLVLDCGATNVRAGAVDRRGRILHLEALPNAAVPQGPGRDWLIWDTDAIWEKLLACARRTISAAGASGCVSVVVTSFSDDGAPVDARGRLLYPVISWQCSRTAGMIPEVTKRIPMERLHEITGELPLPQHSLFRLLWLRRFAPDTLTNASKYLMFPHIINHRLTGRMVNDPTTADSMFLLDIASRRYSRELLDLLRIDDALLPEMLEPGQVIGALLGPVAAALGLDRPVPVVAGGHDTQYAVLGSGCAVGDVVLSSGTWEILFTRTRALRLSSTDVHLGLKHECDPVSGIYQWGGQWLGSGALEWMGRLLYPDVADRSGRYVAAQAEAMRVPDGSRGVRMVTDLVPGTLCGEGTEPRGVISGLSLGTTRGEIYRSMIESLCRNMKTVLQNLESVSSVKFDRLIVVGGGARNALWNQVRADTLGIPIQLTSQVENTLVGAMVIGLVGAGICAGVDEALGLVDFSGRTILPGRGGADTD
jgi:L-fuculokinase